MFLSSETTQRGDISFSMNQSILRMHSRGSGWGGSSGTKIMHLLLRAK